MDEDENNTSGEVDHTKKVWFRLVVVVLGSNRCSLSIPNTNYARARTYVGLNALNWACTWIVQTCSELMHSSCVNRTYMHTSCTGCKLVTNHNWNWAEIRMARMEARSHLMPFAIVCSIRAVPIHVILNQICSSHSFVSSPFKHLYLCYPFKMDEGAYQRWCITYEFRWERSGWKLGNMNGSALPRWRWICKGQWRWISVAWSVGFFFNPILSLRLRLTLY